MNTENLQNIFICSTNIFMFNENVLTFNNLKHKVFIYIATSINLPVVELWFSEVIVLELWLEKRVTVPSVRAGGTVAPAEASVQLPVAPG